MKQIHNYGSYIVFFKVLRFLYRTGEVAKSVVYARHAKVDSQMPGIPALETQRQVDPWALLTIQSWLMRFSEQLSLKNVRWLALKNDWLLHIANSSHSTR